MSRSCIFIWWQKMYRKPRNDKFLNWWWAIACALILFASDLPMDGHGAMIVGLVMGGAIWYATKVDKDELSARVILGIGFVFIVSLLSNVFLWVTCKFAEFQVCSPNNLRANYFANFFFPQILVVISSLGAGLSSIIRKE